MRNIFRYTPEFILTCYILLFLLFKHPWNNWDRVINSDGKGYYAYLTGIFIYHDLTWKFVESYEEKYYPPDKLSFKEFRMQTDGGTVNKCFPGLAILWLPFFLVAHCVCLIFGLPADGYSILYQFSIAIAALFYLWLGCKILYKLLLRLNSTIEQAAFITLLIGLGTNLIYYTLIEGSMTHVYSFALITAFLYSLLRMTLSPEWKWPMLAFLLIGLIILVRPVNGLVLLLVPFIFSLNQVPFNFFVLPLKKKLLTFLYGFACLSLLFLIPLCLWHLQSGRWLIYSYGDEHFNFSDPRFFSLLFSFNRGWFVYTPIAFVSMAGFLGLFYKNKKAFSWLFIFLLIFIFVSSSWWMWFYASKCGQRIFVDILVVVGLLLMFLFKWLDGKKIIHRIVSCLLVLLLCLNLVQFYQHVKWIFPSININWNIYRDAFFSLHPQARVYIPEKAIVGKSVLFNDLEKNAGWMNEGTLTCALSHSGAQSSLISSKQPYSTGLSISLAGKFTTANRVISTEVYLFLSDGKTEASLVADFGTQDKSLWYKAFYLEQYIVAGKWIKIETAFYVPKELPKDGQVKLYVFLPPGNKALYIDDWRIEFLSLKDDNIYRKLDGVQIP